MLNQLIYTRCYPARDLKNGGNVVYADGFGVFSLSEHLLDDLSGQGGALFQQCLPIKNGAGAGENTATGLFSSYELLSLSPGRSALTFEFARPRCTVPRKNGRSHRPGTYIKQSLVGQFRGYPYEWFGSQAWDAYRKSENDYYLDDPGSVPPLLPPVNPVPAGGNVDAAEIRAFIQDGRREPLKAAIWFLLQECQKPEGERKVLLIRDLPQNVILWVAAIESAFSPEMAWTIPFATNRSKLGAQPDHVLFYYTDPSGRIAPTQNRSVTQARHPYCMIVGYHPRDPLCSAVKALPASNFVLLDGEHNTVSFTPDASIDCAYFRAAAQCGEEISDFCRVVLPSLHISRLSRDLPELFDAYQYLLDSNHKSSTWRYGETMAHLSAFLAHGVPDNSALNSYLLDECLRAYPQMMKADQDRRLPLLGAVAQIAQRVGRQGDIVALLMDYAQPLFSSLSVNGSALSRFWDGLRTPALKGIVPAVLSDLLNDTELGEYAQQLPSAAPATANTVLEMYIAMLTQNGTPLARVQESPVEFDFLCAGLLGVMRDPVLLQRQLHALQGSSALFNAAALAVAERCSPKQASVWWDAVITAGGSDLPGLCRSLSQSKGASVRLIEQLLSNRVTKLRRCDLAVMEAFTQALKDLPAEKDSGVLLFGAWIDIAPLSEYRTIIPSAQACRLSEPAQRSIFQKLDASLPVDCRRETDALSSLGSWASRLGISSASVSLAELCLALEKAKKTDAALAAARAFTAKKLPMRPDFPASACFSDFCRWASEFDSGELDLLLLCAFVFPVDDPGARAQYLRALLSGILAQYKNRHLLDGMAILTETVAYAYTVPGRSQAEVERIQDAIERELVSQFTACYHPSMPEKAAKKGLPKAVRDKLDALLKEAARHAPKDPSLRDLARGLFKKR